MLFFKLKTLLITTSRCLLRNLRFRKSYLLMPQTAEFQNKIMIVKKWKLVHVPRTKTVGKLHVFESCCFLVNIVSINQIRI